MQFNYQCGSSNWDQKEGTKPMVQVRCDQSFQENTFEEKNQKRNNPCLVVHHHYKMKRNHLGDHKKHKNQDPCLE